MRRVRRVRRVRQLTPRLPIHALALLLVLLLPAIGVAAEADDQPVDVDHLVDLLGEAPVPPSSPGGDPCACFPQLRSCLLAATLNLGRCAASLPAGDALCYIKYEIDVLLCIHQADNCASTCIP